MKQEAQPKDELMEAQIKLQRAHQEKLQKCSQEINEVLTKYGFQLKVEQVVNLIPKQ